MILVEAELYAAAISPQVGADIFGDFFVFADVPYGTVFKKLSACNILIETAVALDNGSTAVLLFYSVGKGAQSFGYLFVVRREYRIEKAEVAIHGRTKSSSHTSADIDEMLCLFLAVKHWVENVQHSRGKTCLPRALFVLLKKLILVGYALGGTDIAYLDILLCEALPLYLACLFGYDWSSYGVVTLSGFVEPEMSREKEQSDING